MNQLQHIINAAQSSNSRLKKTKTKMKTGLLSKGATVFFAASSLSLPSVSAAEAAVVAAASSDDLKSTRRQLSNSYASNHRALMSDEQRSDVPDVASIINGTATDGPLSYQVGLMPRPGSYPNCGGSLIAPRVVLTAAHCILNDDYTPKDPPKNKVLINGYNLATGDIPEGSGNVQASSYVVHPEYNPATEANDVALWFLPFPLAEDESFKFATLNEDPTVPADDEELFVSGWGRTVDGDPNSRSLILLGTNVDYVTNEQCRAITGDDTIADGMMCAYRDGTTPCSGDSGGPLVIAKGDGPAMDPPIQVGIVSFHGGGGKCGDFPEVYTRVSSYVDWIRSTACQEVGELCPSSSKSSKARRQLTNSYASNHRALMSDEQRSDVPDVASIINGRPTDGPISYQVGLALNPGKYTDCGGSLIAPRVVLTAAHCILNDDYTPIDPPRNKVLINGYDLATGAIPEGSGYVAASSYVVHPGWNRTTVENDIALWFLPFPIAEDEHFKFATLNEDPTVPAVDEELFVSGWGNTVDGVFSESPILLETNVDYITNEQCRSVLGPNRITDGMLCAYGDGTGTCQGDSGGPLVIANGTDPAMDPPLQVGIVSFYTTDCNQNVPGVYTRVSSYIGWIHSTACQEVGELCSSSSKSSKSKSSKNDRP